MRNLKETGSVNGGAAPSTTGRKGVSEANINRVRDLMTENQKTRESLCVRSLTTPASVFRQRSKSPERNSSCSPTRSKSFKNLSPKTGQTVKPSQRHSYRDQEQIETTSGRLPSQTKLLFRSIVSLIDITVESGGLRTHMRLLKSHDSPRRCRFGVVCTTPRLLVRISSTIPLSQELTTWICYRTMLCPSWNAYPISSISKMELPHIFL